MSRPCRRTLVLLAGLSCVATGVQAAAPDCEVSATGPAFGAYYPSDPIPATTNGSISVQCQRFLFDSTPVNVTITLSTGGAGNFTRRMSAGANRLYYNIFRENSHTSIWGTGTGGSQSVSMTVILDTAVLFGLVMRGTAVRTMFARVDAGQYVPTGPYLDTINVTLNF